ncbi:MAG: phosphohistidine phosphatase [Verrucomicrobiales bacterium]|jgi:phosphohistidine phosphatase
MPDCRSHLDRIPYRLTIVRHAKSDWGEFTTPDWDRPLNDRGQRDAPVMGKRMKERGDAPDLIICSPALRAHTTAKLLAGGLSYPLEKLQLEKKIYEAPVSALLEVIQSCPDSVSHLMMVGHNPGSEQLVQYLTGEPFSDFVTCAVADVALDVSAWSSVGPATGKLLSYWYPKMFSE